nr:phosphotransferase [Halomarina rubra]
MDAPAERVERVDGGLLNETYTLRCAGREYVLQFEADPEHDWDDSLQRGLDCYVALGGSDVPVPDVVTERLGTHGDRTYSLVERLPGETGGRSVPRERAVNAGRVLARLHDHRGFERAGPVALAEGRLHAEAFAEPDPRGRLQEIVGDVVGEIRDAGHPTVAADVQRVVDGSPNLPGEVPAVLCHGDYSPDNVLFAGDDIAGVLDFDRAYAGDARWDLAKAANGFWMHDPASDRDVRREFYAGYRAVAGTDDSFARAEPVYRVATLAAHVGGLLMFEALTDEELAFYAEQLAGAVDRAERLH